MPELDFTLGKYIKKIDDLQRQVERLSHIKLNVSHGCRVYRSTTQSVNDVTDTLMSYDTQVYDTDGCWEGVTNPTKLIARTAGYYTAGASISIAGANVVAMYFSCSIVSYLAADLTTINKWHNGQIMHCTVSLPARLTVVTGMVYLNIGDAISIVARHNAGSAKDIEAATSALEYRNCAWLTRV